MKYILVYVLVMMGCYENVVTDIPKIAGARNDKSLFLPYATHFHAESAESSALHCSLSGAQPSPTWTI